MKNEMSQTIEAKPVGLNGIYSQRVILLISNFTMPRTINFVIHKITTCPPIFLDLPKGLCYCRATYYIAMHRLAWLIRRFLKGARLAGNSIEKISLC